MTPNEQLVHDTLEARYFDLRNIIASKLKRSPDDEEVDQVAEWAVSKCLRLAGKYDPTRSAPFAWVMQVTWSQIQRFYRTTTSRNGVMVKVAKGDALAYVEGGVEVEGAPERPDWPVGAEEDCIITAIDVKAGRYDGTPH